MYSGNDNFKVLTSCRNRKHFVGPRSLCPMTNKISTALSSESQGKKWQFMVSNNKMLSSIHAITPTPPPPLSNGFNNPVLTWRKRVSSHEKRCQIQSLKTQGDRLICFQKPDNSSNIFREFFGRDLWLLRSLWQFFLRKNEIRLGQYPRYTPNAYITETGFGQMFQELQPFPHLLERVAKFPHEVCMINFIQ